MNEQNDNGAAGAQNEQQFAIHKVYLKDMSFETPNSPTIFANEWQPEVNVELNTSAQPLETNTYECVLTVTVTTKLVGKVAYLCEIQQAGIFLVNGFDEETRKGLLGSYCPQILFPYGREAISDLVAKGGFPQLLLGPVNFDALYAQQQARQQPANTPANN